MKNKNLIVEVCMNKIFLFSLIILIFSGCATDNQIRGLDNYTSFQEVDMGSKYKELQGKIFYIFSLGDSGMNSYNVRNWALVRASTVAYNSGYSAFTILNQYENSELRNETYYESYTETVYRTFYTSRNEATQVPEKVVRYRPMTRQVVVYYCNLQIGLIENNEYGSVNNIHYISQYLPESFFN